VRRRRRRKEEERGRKRRSRKYKPFGISLKMTSFSWMASSNMNFSDFKTLQEGVKVVINNMSVSKNT
jgi:hypothetical protein